MAPFRWEGWWPYLFVSFGRGEAKDRRTAVCREGQERCLVWFAGISINGSWETAGLVPPLRNLLCGEVLVERSMRVQRDA